jgi:hypothetical protein
MLKSQGNYKIFWIKLKHSISKHNYQNRAKVIFREEYTIRINNKNQSGN